MSSFLVSREGLTMLADGVDDAIKFGKIADFPVDNESLSDYFGEYTLEEIFQELNYLNAYALNVRYDDSFEENTYYEGVGEITDYTIDEYLKMLDCYLYQCCEGDTTDKTLYHIMSELQSNIGNIVNREGNPLYEEAPWG